VNQTKQNAELSSAMMLLRQGRFADAVPIYKKLLRRDPQNIAVANLLGVSLIRAGHPEEAISVIRGTLKVDPNQDSAHYNLGTVLQAIGRHEEAIEHFQAAIRLNPADAEAFNNLGAALKALRRLDEALDAYQAAVRIRPNFTEAHLNIGNTLHSLGRSIEGLEAVDRAIKLNPAQPAGYLSAGNIMLGTGFQERAIPHFREALRLGSTAASTYFRLAMCLYDTKAREEALAVADEGFKQKPETAEDYAATGGFLQRLNRNEEAVAYFNKALVLDADLPGPRLALANSLSVLGRAVEAEQHYEELGRRHPDYQKTIYNKALVDLSAGDFQKGWDEYEARFADQLAGMVSRDFPFPLWAGGKAGKLLVWMEQGLGDQILYASMIEEARERTDEIILEMEPRLVPLMARSFPAVKVIPPLGERVDISADAHTPIAGLGKFFRRDWKDFRRTAYLIADRARAEALRPKIASGERCAIGISWQSVSRKTGIFKTAALDDLTPLLQRPEFQFIDLQYGDTSGERDALREKRGISIQHLDEIDNTNDIDGLAALIEACDAVVTVSNTTAHLAGALGKPVWIMVPQGHGRLWYWFRDRTDSPWDPGARIVRQQPGQSWADLVASIVPEILEFARGLKRGG
jgi:tetratricopeptide (TPR) repeat protein